VYCDDCALVCSQIFPYFTDLSVASIDTAYFGIWGSFFNGTFLLGTWLRENKKIAFIVREEDGDEGEGDDNNDKKIDEDAEMNAAFDNDYN
jgi:hypothetical protein